MIKQALQTITTPDPYSKMFFVIGLFLSTAHPIFNANGRNLLANAVSALSSPDLFYLIISISGIFLGIRSALKGSITGQASPMTQKFAIFPIQTVIETIKSLTALLLGLLIPQIFYATESLWPLLAFILLVSVSNVFVALLLHYSYKDTTANDWAKTEFKMINALIAIFFLVIFYCRLIYE